MPDHYLTLIIVRRRIFCRITQKILLRYKKITGRVGPIAGETTGYPGGFPAQRRRNTHTDESPQRSRSIRRQFGRLAGEGVSVPINKQIAGYTPMNGTKEFISSIVEAVVGVKLPFSDLV